MNQTHNVHKKITLRHLIKQVMCIRKGALTTAIGGTAGVEADLSKTHEDIFLPSVILSLVHGQRNQSEKQRGRA